MKRRKNILAVLLAVTVMATAMPGSAIAAPVDGQTTEVSAKAGTEKAEKKEQIRVISITDPKLEKGSFARGTKVKDMKLPDKLSAKKQRISRSKMLHGKQTIKRIPQQASIPLPHRLRMIISWQKMWCFRN